MKGLLDQANKAEAQSDYVALYFLAGMAKDVACKVEIPSKDDYTASLKIKLTDSEYARADAAEKKATVDKLRAGYNGAKTKYEAAQASRRMDLLKKLMEEPKPA